MYSLFLASTHQTNFLCFDVPIKSIAYFRPIPPTLWFRFPIFTHFGWRRFRRSQLIRHEGGNPFRDGRQSIRPHSFNWPARQKKPDSFPQSCNSVYRRPQRTQAEPVAYPPKKTSCSGIRRERTRASLLFRLTDRERDTLTQSFSRVFVLMQKVWGKSKWSSKAWNANKKMRRRPAALAAVAYLYGNEIADINLISAHRIIRRARGAASRVVLSSRVKGFGNLVWRGWLWANFANISTARGWAGDEATLMSSFKVRAIENGGQEFRKIYVAE